MKPSPGSEKKIKKGGAEIENYQVPDSPVKIPDGDTGFAFVKNNYRRFIWTWNDYTAKKPKNVT